MALESQCRPDNNILSLEATYIILVLLTIKSKMSKWKKKFFHSNSVQETWEYKEMCFLLLSIQKYLPQR